MTSLFGEQQCSAFAAAARWANVRRRALIVIAIVWLATNEASGAFAQQIVQIGVTIPLTSALSLTGKEYADTLQLAEEDINKAGGIQGKTVHFVVEDSQGSNGAAVNAFVKVVQEYKPPFVFLTSYTTQNAAVAPEVTKAGVPVMYAGGGSALSTPRNPLMFRIRPEDSVAASAMAQFAHDTLKLSRPGIVYVQNDFGQGGANSVAQALRNVGTQVAGVEAYGQNDKDMSAQLLSLKNKGADGILAFVYPQDGALLLQQIKMLGLKQPVIVSSSGFVPAAAQLLPPEDYDNVWGVVDAYLPRTDKGRVFAARFKRRFGMDAGAYGVAYYDGALLMAQAMNATGMDAEKLQHYLATVQGFQGVAHIYSADVKGNLVHDVSVVMMKPGTKEQQFVQVIQVK